MKKLLLLLLTAVFAVTAMAQTSIETALDLKGGDNNWTLENSYDYYYWRYTPSENTLLTVSVSTGYFSVATYRNEGDAYTQSLSGVRRSDNSSVFYLEQGKTYYVSASGNTTGTLTATMETGGNVGKGLSAGDPMHIIVGEEAFMGVSLGTGNNQTTYATYTSTDDGVLELTLTTYAQVSVNGGTATAAESVSSTEYVYKFAVTNGETYSLTLTHYMPLILTAKITHPVEGSLDMPFTLVEGVNIVPAGAGEYWYTFTNTSTGYATISSSESLSRGQVMVYSNKAYIDYGQTYATSDPGYYDVRFELPYTNNTYYICVNRVGGNNESKFNFTVEDYKQGEKEDDPIVLESLPATETTSNAGGTYYYAVDIPVGDHKFLNVEAQSEITNTATSVAVYVQGNSYNATSGNASVRAEVNGGTSGQRYIIRWTSQETQPIEFTVSLEDIKEGDLISNPIEAVLGSNTIDADGTRYYTYTPTKSCKLVLTTPKIETTASFSVYSYGYYTPVTASNSGNVYSLSVTEGTQYYIQLNNAVADEKFTLAEAEFEQGETRDNPIIVEDGKFTFGSETYGDYWLQYTADRAGKLVIESDVPYNYTERMHYGRSTDSYLPDMVMSSYDGSTSTTVYGAEVNAAAGDVFLVNLKMTAPHEGCVITFTIRDFEAGEAASTAIELTEDVAVSVPSVSRTAPMWYKVSLPEASKVTITADNFVSGYWYQGLESTTGSGEYMTFNSSRDEVTFVTTYIFTKDVAAAGDYYIMIDQCYGNTNMTLSVDTSSGIGSVDAGTAISLDGNTLNINVDNADVRVYTLSGAAVVSEKVSGNASFSLDKGIYIVKINNTVKKVIVR